MRLLKINRLICCILLVCLTFSFGFTAYAAPSNDIQFMKSINTDTVKSMNSAMLNSFLLNKLKSMEGQLLNEFHDKCKYIDGFRVDEVSLDTQTGTVALKFYAHFKYKKGIIKITTHGTFGVKANLFVASDASAFGVGDFTVTEFNINNFPGEIEKEIKNSLNRKDYKTIWTSDSAPAQYEKFTEASMSVYITKLLNENIETSLVKELPNGLGTVEGRIENLNCSEFSFARGVSDIGGDIKVLLTNSSGETQSFDLAHFNIHLDLFVDTSDNKLIIKISPEINLALLGELFDDDINKALKEQLLKDGEYIKLLRL